jgi:hypothetical protein
MKNSHLVEILKTLNEREIKELSEFIRSPFFNKNKSVISLFDYLKKYYPEFPEEKVEKEIVYTKIFEGAKYNDGFMRKIMFTLSQLSEEYLSYKGFKANTAAQQNILLKEYLSRSSTLFTKTYKNISSQKSTNKVNTEQFYYSYLFSYRNLSFGAEHKSVDFAKFTAKNDMYEPMEYLSAHYYISIMNLYEYYLNTQRMLKLDVDTSQFEKIISSFDEEIINKYSLVKIHYYLIKMLTEPDNENHYLETKNLLIENENTFDEQEQDNIIINLQNYCMRKIRANKPGYSKELFEIYKMELAGNKFTSENNISVILYRNIVFTALQLGEIQFADEFAEKYRHTLMADIRDSNYYYVKAHIFLKKKDLDKAVSYLSKIKSIDELLKADVKTMYIQVYYETGAVEQLYSVIDSFRHYLKANARLSEERKSLYEVFNNFSARLMGLKVNYDAFKLSKLKSDIEGGENIINKGWLLDKISELENKKGRM